MNTMVYRTGLGGLLKVSMHLFLHHLSSNSLISSLVFLPASCLVLDRYGLLHQARMSASINAMRVLNTGTEVEAAVADALVRRPNVIGVCRCVILILIGWLKPDFFLEDGRLHFFARDILMRYCLL